MFLRAVAQNVVPTRQHPFIGNRLERHTLGPGPPRHAQPGTWGLGWRSVLHPLPGDAAVTQAENQAVPQVTVLAGRGEVPEVQSPPPSQTTRGKFATACPGNDTDQETAFNLY